MRKSSQDCQRKKAEHEITHCREKTTQIAHVQVEQVAHHGKVTKDRREHRTEQRQSKDNEQQQPQLCQETSQNTRQKDTAPSQGGVDLSCSGRYQEHQKYLRKASTGQELQDGKK